MRGLLYILFLLLLFVNLSAYEECDSIRTCTQNAITFEVTSGKGAHYLEVQNTESIEAIVDSMTVDFWLKAEEQPDKNQFIAGIWGPGDDYNDVWSIYIDRQNRLTFQINGENSNKGYTDNTFCSLDYNPFFGDWQHIYAIFDGSTSKVLLYVNGELLASGINAEYPVKRLRKRANEELNMQIGSTNAVSDDLNLNRTLLGQIDEFRLWNKIFDEDRMFCQKDESLEGNEKGLVLYHRYNETPDNYIICDATGNGNFGMARSGASCTPSQRYYQNTLIVTSLGQELPLKDTIVCDEEKTYSFEVHNISQCPKSVTVRIRGDYPNKYTISPLSKFNLEPDEKMQFSVNLQADFVGKIRSVLDVYNGNRCRDWNSYYMDITRLTEFSYSTDTIGFNVLKANCLEVREDIRSVTICNNSNAIGAGRTVQIENMSVNNPEAFQILLPKPLPIQLSPGECIDIPVKFNNLDFAGDFYDTLKIETDDKCDTTRKIELEGHIIEVFKLTDESGNNEITKFDFGTECIDYITPAESYIWQNLTKDNPYIEEEDIYIDTIIVPEHFISKNFDFPVNIDTYDGHYIHYFRFLPTAQGNFVDSVIFIIKSGECTIEKKVEVSGKGYYANLQFDDAMVDFGDVIIGQEKTIDIPITNLSDEPVNLLAYLKYGSGFYFASGQDLNLAPNQTKKVSIIFRPIVDSTYTDELCYLEKRCYESDCITLNGKGIYQIFSYEPNILLFDKVLACDSKIDSIQIANTGSSPIVLSNFIIDDQSNKYTYLDNNTLLPTALPNIINFAPGNKLTFVFSYAPDDITMDRADRAFLRFVDDKNQDWHLKLFATSVNPKIYITEETKYGIIEVSDSKRDTLVIENISQSIIALDSLSVSDGFEIVYPNPTNFSQDLNPGDTIMLIVDFVPTVPKYYEGIVYVGANSPCVSYAEGKLTGNAIIVPLEVPISTISYGYIKSCDCEERNITLINASNTFPMVIDSVWIDDFNASNPYPEFFTWTSSFYKANGEVLPYEIPAGQFDTLVVSYCPGNPSKREFINNDATLHLTSHGQSWERNFDVYLSGKRNLTFEADPTYVAFPPTRVDTLAPSRYVNITIPEIAVNPEQMPLKIDSISFSPAERVFSAIDYRTGLDKNITLALGDTLPLQIDFKPRAVREYYAKMILHFSEPCPELDSTIELYGSAFAPAYALNFRFDTLDIELDTFKMISCDTLSVPIYSSREIPAEIVDIGIKIIYDTDKLDLIGADSYYLTKSCFSYSPSISIKDSSADGKALLLKNFCGVDSLKPLCHAKFVSKLQMRDTLLIKMDSLTFDTEEVILYDIIATNDSAMVVILEPDFRVSQPITYDSVQILDCVTRTFEIVNSGDIPISLSSILNLPTDVLIVNSVPALDVMFDVGDTAFIEIEYCPQSKDTIDTEVYPFSNDPCQISDTSFISGYGFAPDLPLAFKFDLSVLVPEFSGTIGERLTIPVFLDTNLSTILKGKEHWLRDLQFDLRITYNPRALQYIGLVDSKIDFSETDYQPGNIVLKANNIDSLSKGQLFNLIFEATVPDVISSDLQVEVSNLDSQELMFLDLYPSGGKGIYNSDGKCFISYFKFESSETQLFGNYPNPWSEKTTVRFKLGEKVPVSLDLYSYTGEKIETLIDSNYPFERGEYSIELLSGNLKSGLYYLTFKAGIYTENISIMLVK